MIEKYFLVNKSQPSLDNNPKSARQYVEWSRKQKRAYSKILSGIKRHSGGRLRFFTLTTAEHIEGKISDCFRKLKQRLQRLTKEKVLHGRYTFERGGKHYSRAFMDGTRYLDARDKYNHLGLRQKFMFHYSAIKTTEGNGVYHVLYFGEYIPQRLLSKIWKEITKTSFVVDIQDVNKGTDRKTASYCVSQYSTTKQGTDYERISYSWSWVCRGFYGLYKMYCKDLEYDFNLINLGWNKFLMGESLYIKTNNQVVKVNINGKRYKVTQRTLYD